MSKIITDNKLNRFWQKGIEPIKKLLGNTNISAIGDGTLTGGLDTLNNNLKWKLLKSQTTFGSNNVINLPETYNELYICSEETGTGAYKGGIIIPFDFVSTGNTFYGCGTNKDGYSVKVNWIFNSDSSIYPNQIFINNVDVTNQYTFKVYYR